MILKTFTDFIEKKGKSSNAGQKDHLCGQGHLYCWIIFLSIYGSLLLTRTVQSTSGGKTALSTSSILGWRDFTGI